MKNLQARVQTWVKHPVTAAVACTLMLTGFSRLSWAESSPSAPVVPSFVSKPDFTLAPSAATNSSKGQAKAPTINNQSKTSSLPKIQPKMETTTSTLKSTAMSTPKPTGETKMAPAAVASAPVATQPVQASGLPVKPFRTFISLQRYTVENNGDIKNPVSNVRLVVKFSETQEYKLPEDGAYWPIANGQFQEINRVYEIPFSMLQKNGFKFTVQMDRKESRYLPCNFEVQQLSEFNRVYTCHTDINWQKSVKNIPDEKLDRQGLQVRVFTDLNSKPNEIPNQALALK